METNVIYNADVFDKLPKFDDNSIEAIVTDPPYNLKFMGKSWDDKGGPKEFQEWNERWASIAYDKLKPGGYMIVFSSTKTYHRMVSGIEDAGFEIKDMIEWMYGTGFPKNYNISKGFDKQAGAKREKVKSKWAEKYPNGPQGNQFSVNEDPDGSRTGTPKTSKPATDKARKWQGYGTALKPAHEPLVLAQKPREGTYCNNVEKYGCGGLNIDECRVEGTYSNEGRKIREEEEDKFGVGIKARKQKNTKTRTDPHDRGRFPANLVLSHHPDCEYQGAKNVDYRGAYKNLKGTTSVFGTDDKEIDIDTYGEDGKETVEDWDCHPSCPIRRMNEQSGELDSGVAGDKSRAWGVSGENIGKHEAHGSSSYDDKGGAARYFNQFHFRDEDFFRYTAKASKSERTCDGNVSNDHPTVKPLELMEWLVRLATPPEGVAVDPFAGSGTTLIAAYEQGLDYIGIEKDKKSVKIIRERLDYHKGPKQQELV